MGHEDKRKPGKALGETEEQVESRRILEGVARDSESIGRSSFARVANRAVSHLDAADSEDEIERWGKRIARILALIAFIALAYHLLFTYIIPV